MNPLLAFTILFLSTLNALAAPVIETPAAIRRAVEAELKAVVAQNSDVVFRIGRLDPRLRLPKCQYPLRAANGSERHDLPSAIQIRCEGSSPWSIYVPVMFERYATVVVARRALAPRASIQEADVTLSRRKLSVAENTYFTTLDAVIGQNVKRAIHPGQIIGANKLDSPQLIRRGDQVVLSSSAGNLAVSVRGKALEDGRLGDQIAVQNSHSERVVQGKVAGEGLVVVRTATVL